MSNQQNNFTKSYHATRKYYRLPGVNALTIAIYHELLNMVNEEKGFAFPSRTYLENIFCCTPKSITEATKKLKEYGLIEKIERDGFHGGNHYYMRMPIESEKKFEEIFAEELKPYYEKQAKKEKAKQRDKERKEQLDKLYGKKQSEQEQEFDSSYF